MVNESFYFNGGFNIYRKHAFILMLFIILVGAISTASAVDLNATDAVAADDVDYSVAVENDNVISADEYSEAVSVDENAENVSSAENVDEVSVTDDSEVLGVTRYVNPGDNLGSVIGSASSGDTIIINGGSYYICDFSIGKSLTFIGQNNPILTTNERGDKCMLFIKADVTFKNLILQDARAQWGAACYVCSNCLFTVDNCIFRNNYASKGGGAILCDNGGRCKVSNSYFAGNVHSNTGGAIRIETSAEIVNCTFEGNVAGSNGGAIYICGGSASRIENCTFKGCHAGCNNGGAIMIKDSAQCTISNTNFVGNDAPYGGAIFVDNYANCVVVNSTFVNGTCWYGGAIFTNENTNQRIDTIKVMNSTFIGNYARDSGGACYIQSVTNSIISNCTFINNKAGNGGALTNRLCSNARINDCYFFNNSGSPGGAVAFHAGSNFVNGCTFENNHATDYGGAISASYDGCSFTVSNSTFSDNYANYGGAVFTDDKNTVLAKVVDSCFENNHANRAGGSIYIQVVTSSMIDNCSFANDSADISGGSINYYQANNCNVANCQFADCTSVTKGAAIYLHSGNNLKLTGNTFNNCISQDANSGCFDSGSSSYTVLDCVFDVIPQGIPYHHNSILSANNLSIVKGDDGIISAKLSNVVEPLSNREVTFTVDGNKYARTTASDGIATFNVKDYITDLGSHEVIVGYDGDSVNLAVSQVVNVKLNIYAATLTVTQSGRYYGGKSVSFKLVDSKTGKAKSDVPIHVDIYSGGEIYKTADISTQSNGMITYSMSTFEPGNYTVKAYVTSPNVDVNDVEENVSIYKISGDIELSKSNSNKTLNVKLVNPENGDVYGGINVKLQFSPNGYETTVTTDSSGVAAFHIQFDVGTYSVVASVDSSGFKEFANAELRNIVISTTGKDDSVIEFDNAITFNYLGSGSTTVKRIEGCTIGEVSVDNHPEAKIVVDGNKIAVSKLDAGTYTLRVTTNPDIYHNAVTRTVAITVNKIDSTLNINPVSINYGDSATLTASVGGGAISYKDVIVEGQNPTINVINNVITVTGLPAGTHTLKVSTTPDENHKSVTKTTTITVKKINSNIGFDTPLSFVYGTVGSISLKLEGCGIVKEGCTIVDHNEAVINVDKNVVKVSNLAAGQYTLRISSKPDSNHNAVTQDIVVTVSRADSNVDLKTKPLTFDYGSVGQSNLILDGCSVLSDDVTVVGHSEANTRVSNNVVSVSNLAAGSYTLQIKTTPDGNHKSVTKTFSVTVNKPLSAVEFIGSADFDYLGVGKTTMKLDGCTVNLDNIEVVGYSDAGISLGKGNIISISDLNSGNYTLKVKTTPDNNHRVNTATLPFTVNKIDSKISFTKDSISFKYAKSGSTPIVLENCKVANMSIVGQNVKPVLKGDAISVSGLAVGKYVLKVTTEPNDDNYNPVDAFINVVVSINTATISVKKTAVAYKTNSYWSVTLKDSSKTPISGLKVTLKLYKGKKLFKTINNLKTNSKGVASYKTSALPVGTYKGVFSVSHKGYTCKSVSSSINVIKQTVLKYNLKSKVNDKDGSLLSYMVLNKKTGKGINGLKIKVLIHNGKGYKEYILKTKKIKGKKVYNGAFGFSTNSFSVGKHTVKIMPVDTVRYNGIITTSITISKSAAKGPKFFRVV